MSFPIKIAFNGELRRFMSAAPSYVEIVAAVQQMFPRLGGGFSLKYEDEENELITISSDMELTEAMSICEQLHRKTLKLIVVSRDEDWVSVSPANAAEKEIKEEEKPKEQPKEEKPKEEPAKEPVKEPAKEEPKEESAPTDDELAAALRALATDEQIQAELPKMAEAVLSDAGLDALLDPNLPLADLLRNIATPQIAAHPSFARLLAGVAQAKVIACWARLREHLLALVPLIRAWRPTILLALPAIVVQLPTLLQCWADKMSDKWEDGDCDFAQFFPCLAGLGGMGGLGGMPFMGAFMGGPEPEPNNEEVDKEPNKEAVHRGVTCDGCGMAPILGIRFKCTVCPNYDLCSACEAKGEHAPSHPLLQLRGPAESENVHRGVLCNVCGVTPIKGARFKCTVCPDFDLCDDCEQKTEHPHPLLKMRKPEERPEWRRRHHGHHHGHHGGPHHGGPHGGPHHFFRRRFGPGCGGPAAAAAGPDAPPAGFGAFGGLGGGFGGGMPFGPMFRMFGGGRGGFRCPRNPNGHSSAFVGDVSLPDGAEVTVGTDVLKTWKLRNDGPQAWPEGTTLILKRCRGAFESTPQPLAKLAAPGEEVEVSAVIRALEPGRGTVCFRLADASGQPFGAKVWADVLAKPAAAPSAPEEPKKEEPAAAPKAEADSPYELALSALAAMGFANREFNLSLLEKEKGNLERVIMRLLEGAM